MGMAAILVMTIFCDLDHLNKLSFPRPKEAPHEIWLQLAVVSEEMFENVENADNIQYVHTYIPTDDRGLPIL